MYGAAGMYTWYRLSGYKVIPLVPVQSIAESSNTIPQSSNPIQQFHYHNHALRYEYCLKKLGPARASR